MVVAAVVFVPLTLLQAIEGPVLDADVDALTDAEAGAILTFVILLSALTLAGEVFYSGAVSSVILGVRAGRRIRLARIAASLPYRRLIAIDLLFNLALAALLILLIVPGIVFFTFFILTAPVAELEDLGVRAAFRRSRELVRGRFWAVLAVLGPITLGLTVLMTLGGVAGAAVLGESILGHWLGMATVQVLLVPVYASAACAVAIELIEERGGRLSGATA